ncbi:MAG: hypothetical protein ACRDPY_19150 [Streptosporangiaceae bacterium]
MSHRPGPRIHELLAEHAAARRQVVDEHMFTVTREGGSRMGTFRLQVFTTPGARPVAVATQTWREGGSLTNRAEKYAAEVWRRHLSQDTVPPVWIELQLLNVPGHPDRFTLVTFDQLHPYQLVGPQWCQMSDGEIEQLVGGPVDRSRGEGYQPWPVPPEELPVYRVAWVVLLPKPEGMDRGCIRATPPWWQRASRQLIPRRQTRDCYYHSIDWHRVSAAAIRIVRRARAEALTGEELTDRLSDLANGAKDLPDLERHALWELLSDGAGIQLSDDGSGRGWPYINGRHRVTAMLEAGVRRTVIIHWEMPEEAGPESLPRTG